MQIYCRCSGGQLQMQFSVAELVCSQDRGEIPQFAFIAALRMGGG